MHSHANANPVADNAVDAGNGYRHNSAKRLFHHVSKSIIIIVVLLSLVLSLMLPASSSLIRRTYISIKTTTSSAVTSLNNDPVIPNLQDHYLHHLPATTGVIAPPPPPPSSLVLPSPQRRIALCISGNARTFHYHSVHGTLLQYVVAPLKAVADVDVFFNIKLTDDPRPQRPRAARNDTATLSAMAKFNPVQVRQLADNDSYTVDPARLFAVNERLMTRPSHCNESLRAETPMKKDFRKTADVPHALHRMRQCYDLVSRYEQQQRHRQQQQQAYGDGGSRFQYDWFYKIRPDVAFLDDIALPLVVGVNATVANVGNASVVNTVIANISPEKWTKSVKTWWEKTATQTAATYGHIGDHFMAAHRSVAQVAFNAIQALDECDVFVTPIRRNPESVLLFWLLTHNITAIATTTPWVLVREKKAECKRLRMFTIKDADKRSHMIERCRLYKRQFKI